MSKWEYGDNVSCFATVICPSPSQQPTENNTAVESDFFFLTLETVVWLNVFSILQLCRSRHIFIVMCCRLMTGGSVVTAATTGPGLNPLLLGFACSSLSWCWNCAGCLVFFQQSGGLESVLQWGLVTSPRCLHFHKYSICWDRLHSSLRSCKALSG